MKTLGIIPARYDSTRFPGKPLLDLKGKTMIQRVYEGAKKSTLLTEVCVATDDQRIYDAVTAFGGRVFMTSKDHPSGTDRCAEVAENFPDFDVVINIQGDEPLVDFRQIDSLIRAFESEEVQIASLGIKESDAETIQNPNRIKIVIDHKQQALYFSRSILPNSNHFSGDPVNFYPYLRHIGLYAYRNRVLQELTALEPTKLEKIESLEQLRWLYYGYRIHIVETEIETPNIDAPDDVERVLKLIP